MNGQEGQTLTDADRVRAAEDQYATAVARMGWRDSNHYRVVFHFEDGSTVTFKKTYTLEDLA